MFEWFLFTLLHMMIHYESHNRLCVIMVCIDLYKKGAQVR